MTYSRFVAQEDPFELPVWVHSDRQNWDRKNSRCSTSSICPRPGVLACMFNSANRAASNLTVETPTTSKEDSRGPAYAFYIVYLFMLAILQ